MLSARFHTLRDRSAKVVDAVFAEPVFLMPKASTNVEDGVTFEAPLRTGERDAKGMSGGRGQGWNAQIAGTAATMYIDGVANPEARPKEGDRLHALAREGQPWFEVAFVDSRNHARIVVHLREA